jgi:PAS domain S-box-containing protein
MTEKPDENEEYIRLLARMSDDAPVSILIHDFDGIILYANEETFRLHGFTREEFLQKNLHEIDVPESERLIAARMQQIRKNGKADFEVRHFRKDGTTFPLHVNAKIVAWSGRDVLLSIATDLTECKQAEANLHDREALYQVLFQSSRDAMMTLEPPLWRFTSGNPATVQMFLAKDEAEFTSQKPWTLSTDRQPDGRESGEKAKEMIETAMQNGTHFFEWTHKRFNGEDFPTTVLLSRVEGAKKVFLQATVRDITGQKRKEEQLRESSERVQLLLNSTAEAIYGMDMQGLCTLCNAAFLRMLGYDRPGQILGRNVHDMMHHTHADNTSYRFNDCRIFKEILRGEGTHADDEVFWRYDGTSFPVEYWSYPIRKEGIIVGAVVTFFDITGRKTTEEQLRHLLNEKEILLHEIHHRVRNTIQLAVSMMKMQVRRKNDDRVREAIISTQNRLNAIASTFDRLYYSEDMSRVNLRNIISSIVGSIHSAYENGEHSLQTDIRIDIMELGVDLALPIALITSELVTNAFQNAFPEGRSGMVTITGSEDEQGRIILTVSDNGSGLPVEFSPAESDTTGFTLVHILVDQISGTLRYTSSSEGTCFMITIPKAAGTSSKM